MSTDLHVMKDSPDTVAAVLVVDDHQDLLDNIELALGVEGYRVLTALDGIEALEVLANHKVDLILADISMPRMNGYQLFERVRENPAWITIPFVFLTARSMDSDIDYGKEMGVDDYLTKPIRVAELLSVVQGKLRRARQLSKAPAVSSAAGGEESGEGTLQVGRLRIEPDGHYAWLGDEQLNLSVKEFRLLECLARKAGKLVSQQELVKVTHELDLDYEDARSLLRPLVSRLRRKLGHETGEMGCIENVRGAGYRLVIGDD